MKNMEMLKPTKEKTETPKEREKREKFINNLKAAEILCMVDLKKIDDKSSLGEVVERLEKEYSKEVIEKAIRVAELREKGISAYRNLLQEQKKQGDKSLVDICKEYQIKGRKEYEFFERNNFYYPAIVELSKALLKDRKKDLIKRINEDEIWKAKTDKEKAEDINKKLSEYEAQYLSRMVIAELARENDLRESLYREEKMTSAGIVRKALVNFAKLPRGVRAATGAFVFGAGVATLAPGLIIGSASAYVAYKTIRAFTGGSVAAGLQKIFGNKIVKNIYEKGVSKAYTRLTKQIKGEEEFKAGKGEGNIIDLVYNIFGNESDVKKFLYKLLGKQEKVEEIEKNKKISTDLEQELEKELKNVEDIIKARNYEKIAELNLKIAEYQLRVLKKHEVFRKFNTIASITATGVIGGAVGANLIDGLFGPKGGSVVSESLKENKVLVGSKVDLHAAENKVYGVGVTTKIDTTAYNLPKTNLSYEDTTSFKPTTQDSVGVGAHNAEIVAGKGVVENSVVESAHHMQEIKTGSVLETNVSKETLEMATIGKGEGVEHAFIRQLKADPEKFGYKGDLNDHLAIKKWSEIKAHQIAIENKYVDPGTGTEIRVRDLGEPGAAQNPAYLLDVDPSGKVKVVEYLEGKPTGGEGIKNIYEYEWTRPKFSKEIVSADLEPKPLEVIEEAQGFPKAPQVLEELSSENLPKSYLISHLENKVLPKVEEISPNFDKLSLLEQEHLLEEIKKSSAPFMKQLGSFRDSLSADEIEIMSNINRHWGEMTAIYMENHNEFVNSLKKLTGLGERDLQSFLSTRVDKIWDVFKDHKFDSAFDLLKKLNPTSKEISTGVLVEDIVKSRFVDGKF